MNKKGEKSLGYLGECYVVLELAKRGIYSQRMHKDFLQDYDLLLSNGMTVEVKTSSILTIKDSRRKNSIRDIWQFTNYKRIELGKQVGRFRECDLYILVCLGKDEQPLKYFVVPSILIGDRQGITIPVKRKQGESYIDDFEEKWDLLESTSKVPIKKISIRWWEN